MSQQKGPRGKHAILEHDENCPYCGTVVKKGVSICTGCQAEHTFEPTSSKVSFFLLLLFFIALFGSLPIFITLGSFTGTIFMILFLALFIGVSVRTGKTDKTVWLRKNLR